MAYLDGLEYSQTSIQRNCHTIRFPRRRIKTIEALNLGPLLIPTRPLLLLASVIVAIWLAGRFGERYGIKRTQARKAAEYTAWAGLAGARLGFALLHWSAYRAAPWTILFLWQPGYLYSGGLIGGGAFALWYFCTRGGRSRSAILGTLAASYLLAGALFAGGIFGLGYLQPADQPGVGDRAPDIRLQNLAGEAVRLSELAGRGVVLNFWATWCPPCRREMPMLDTVQQAYSDAGLSIIGLAVDEPRGQVRRYVDSVGISYPVWVDADANDFGFDRTQTIFSSYGGVGLPTTLFIDRGGIIRRIYVGELSRGFVESEIKRILAR